MAADAPYTLIDRFIVGMDCSFTQPSELVTIESHRPASPLPLSVKAAGGAPGVLATILAPRVASRVFVWPGTDADAPVSNSAQSKGSAGPPETNATDCGSGIVLLKAIQAEDARSQVELTSSVVPAARSPCPPAAVICMP